jgi:hypothetical protein
MAGTVDAELIRRRARFTRAARPDEREGHARSRRARRAALRHLRRKGPRPIEDDATASVRFVRSGRELRWTRPDGTLLPLAEHEGIALPADAASAVH